MAQGGEGFQVPANYQAAMRLLGKTLTQAGEAGLEVLGGEFRDAIGNSQPPDVVRNLLKAFIRGFATANEKWK
jgi:hypothetical protein